MSEYSQTQINHRGGHPYILSGVLPLFVYIYALQAFSRISYYYSLHPHLQYLYRHTGYDTPSAYLNSTDPIDIDPAISRLLQNLLYNWKHICNILVNVMMIGREIRKRTPGRTAVHYIRLLVVRFLLKITSRTRRNCQSELGKSSKRRTRHWEWW